MIQSRLAFDWWNRYIYAHCRSFFIMKKRTTYSPKDKLQIIRAILSRKTSIQKLAKEKGIAPTLISLWKKQADQAMEARFQPQPKGRRKSAPAAAPVSENVRHLKNEARKAKIKASHLETSLKEAKARNAMLEEQVAAMVASLGFKLVKIRRPRRSRKAS